LSIGSLESRSPRRDPIAPDPLTYAGQQREPILTAITQAVCRITSRSWSVMPELTEGVSCGGDLPGIGSRANLDDFVVISHSLGSRATLDALQRQASMPINSDPRLRVIAESFVNRELAIFMLSNQLPLLEAGREGQQVTGQIADYCGDHPAKSGRFFKKTGIIAFSDQNDLLSYPVSDQFASRFIESRLCPNITNVTLNLARRLAARHGRLRQSAHRAHRLCRRRAGGALIAQTATWAGWSGLDRLS
jgi:hypothetical protein